MAVRQIDAHGVRQVLRDARMLFLQGMSGEPCALDAIIRDDPALGSHLSILTSFVSGVNDFDCDLIARAAKVCGFFPPRTPLAANYRQIVSTYYGVAQAIRAYSPDTVFIPVTPRGKDDCVTPGLSAEFVEAALDTASQKVAVICPSMPIADVRCRLPFDRFTHSIVDDTPPKRLNLGAATVDPVVDAIAGHLARLIDDGSTVQTGIGKLPGRLYSRLTRHRNLCIHSGLITGDVRKLVESGALDRDVPMKGATLMGDTDFYRWVDGRRDFRLHPIAHTHSPATLARIDRFVAVNSAIEVDLLGQVNAEKAGGRFVSAAGGLPDFAGAAHRSMGGRSIIALPATHSKGAHSRIVPRLCDDTPVSVPRTDVDFVVTEYGIADLSGKTPTERAKALRTVAAPDHRAALSAYC